jgi:diguanylate cyclase (GGDEF)-like protein/PAS domain S-box-containing protein
MRADWGTMSDEAVVAGDTVDGSSVDHVALVAVASVLPDAVLVIDSLARLRWANRAAERLFGMTLDEAAGRNGLELIHPADLQVAALSLTSVKAKETGTLIELRVRAADGWRLVEVAGAPLGEDIVLSVRDVTERRRWEVAGNDAAQFRSLMQNAASVMVLLTPGGIIRSTSGAVTRLLGHDQEWLEGRPLVDIVAEHDRPTLEKALEDARSAHCSLEGITVDVHLSSADGDPVPFALTITDLLEDPTVEGIAVTGHDITDRLRTEAALREAHSLLTATLDSTADGILVVDGQGRITSFNSQFAELWGLTEENLRSLDDSEAIALVLKQLRDPRAFTAKVEELYATPEAHSHDVLEFKNGRVFERDSLPQRIDDEIVGRVWSFRDVTEHIRLQAELAHQAFHDPLTGLPNRALFRDRVDHATARLTRDGGTLAMLFIDLDDFKTVNDSLGHSAGDALLAIASERLTRVLRPSDTAARLGGDEFVLLLEDLSDRNDAIEIAQRIIAVAAEPLMLCSRQVSARASIGIAYGTAGVECDELIRNADLAMYSAKAAGKNTYRVFTPDMHVAAVQPVAPR